MGITFYKLQQEKRIKTDIVWVDSTTVMAHRRGGESIKKSEQAIGCGRRGWSTKIHGTLSYEGIVNFTLSPGQKQDVRVFHSLCQGWPWHQMK